MGKLFQTVSLFFPAAESELTESQRNLILDNVVKKCNNMLNQFSSEHRDLHSSVSRVGKSVDKNFISDYVCVGNENLFDQEENALALNKVIVEHFLRQGRSDIAESLIKEGKLDVNKRDKTPYIKMNKILGKFSHCFLRPLV